MPTTRPGFIWSGTEWIAIGQEAVLAPVSYQATAPSSPATGDIWIESDVDVPSVDSAQFLRWRKTMTGGETSLSGNDDSSLPLAYTPGYEQLYINGVLQVRGGDYTATTGTTVTGLTALAVNDVVEIFSAVARTVADVYTQTQSDARFVNQVNNAMFLVKPTGATNGTVGANGAVTIGNAVSSVTVQGAFSSTYDNYKIVISGGTVSATTLLALRLGTTNTGYYTSRIRITYASATPSGQVLSNTSDFAFAGYAVADGLYMDTNVSMPFIAKKTVVQSNMMEADTGGGIQFSGGFLNNTTSYTDFQILTTSTMTGGTIRIYGYNNGA
jgi:hypothetical protein